MMHDRDILFIKKANVISYQIKEEVYNIIYIMNFLWSYKCVDISKLCFRWFVNIDPNLDVPVKFGAFQKQPGIQLLEDK